MVKIIMHGCNGHMGQVISDIVEKDPDAEIVAGIDIADQGKNSYPVFTDIDACQVEADAIIDFSSAKATDKLLEYSAARQIPVKARIVVKPEDYRWSSYQTMIALKDDRITERNRTLAYFKDNSILRYRDFVEDIGHKYVVQEHEIKKSMEELPFD